MARSKLYFYLSSLLIIISFYFNTRNPLLNMHFNSIIKLIFVCSIIKCCYFNNFYYFLQINRLNHSQDKSDWIRKASKILPFVLLIVIIIHILSSLSTFGIIF
ncbi:membrane protein [Staphylococcus gallinarum]|uniref:Membrane protein n=1 Tax=Staphylococcus gallinarum TaxID=1293 RepID=A0A380FKJ4_STAGA|nr:membrane protein [Staphylococcus gallinarum]